MCCQARFETLYFHYSFGTKIQQDAILCPNIEYKVMNSVDFVRNSVIDIQAYNVIM